MLLLTLLLACTEPPPEGVGLVGDSLLNPFPSTLHVHDGHLALPELPQAIDGQPIPVELVSWRTGFSPGQVSVVRLPGQTAVGLPGWRDAVPGEGSVLLVDLTDGRFLGVMAELDAHPEAEDPLLLIRPLEAAPVGHQVAVVVTTEVAPRPERFDALLGRNPPEELDAEHFVELMADLEALGVDPESVALAWDYPIGDGTKPLVSALDQLDPPNEWAIVTQRDKDEGERVAPHTWRAATGTITVQDFLIEGSRTDQQADGSVLPTGETVAQLYVHIPESVKDAPAGTVPVMIFGHGIFGRPEGYLDDMRDEGGVLALAEEAGVIVVATRWRGLTEGDRVDAIATAQDFATLPEIPDRLLQAHVEHNTLIAMVRDGGFLSDPVFQGASGQSLPDGSKLTYYGISLGGIEGAVLMGSGADVDAAVLHVGGGNWATMLERSTQWVAFELFIDISVPDPSDRQLLYAFSQLLWDPVDPINWTATMSDKPVLWQESIGDEQVPNLTTEAVARSAGAEVLTPAYRVPWGMASSATPGSLALSQFDAEVGEPADENRPPENTRAHSIPRVWPGARQQVVDFIAPATLGMVSHHCGQTVCTASNPGVP